MKNLIKRMFQSVSFFVSKKKQLRKGILFLWILFLMAPVLAQNITVSGVVVDKTGDALPGVSVSIKGNPTIGMATNLKGEYSLSVPNQNAILEFTYIGFVTQNIPVGNKTRINVTLLEDVKSLDEVVVIGYGVQKRSDVTGSISSVRPGDLDNRSLSDPIAAIQGKLSGVQVLSTSGRPGEAASIRIRGYSSNSSSAASPLYVVDGLIVDNIQYLDPNNIENIEILKDAASAAIYGAQAGNGIVMVTTKKGKIGEGKIFYNMVMTQNSLGHIPQILNAKQYIEYKSEATKTTIADTGFDTDWFDAFFEPTWSQNHTVGFQGGNDRSNIFATINWVNNQGMIKGPYDYYKRLTSQLNMEYKIKSWLTIGSNNSIEKWDMKQMGDRSNWQTPMLGVLRASPLVPPYYGDTVDSLPDFLKQAVGQGKNVLKDPTNGLYYGVLNVGNFGSPLIMRDRGKNNNNGGFNIRGALYLNFTPIKGLVYTSRLGYRLNQSFSKNFTEPYYANSVAQDANYNLSVNANTGWYYQWDNYANFTKRIKKNDIGAMVGMSYVQRETRNVGTSLSGANILTNYAPNFQYIGYASSTATRNSSETNDTSVNMAYFGRLTWGYDNRYNLQANFRADAFDASRLSIQNRWGYFPSFSAGWTISNESFMKEFATNIKLSSMKLRASWGRNGNVNILSNYQYNSTVATAANNFYQYTAGNSATTQGAKPSGVVNKALKWETLEQKDFGLETRFLNNRLTFNAGYFEKNTNDLLVAVPPFVEMGITSNTNMNAGAVKNTGWEFEAGWQEKKGDLKYSINANLSALSNKVTYLDPRVPFLNGSTPMNSFSGSGTRFKVGYPVWYLNGFEYLGVAKEAGYYKKADGSNGISYVAGDPLFKDVNGDGAINDKDFVCLGSGIPKLTFGLTINLAYKFVDLTIFGSGVSGNKIIPYYYDCSDNPLNNMMTYYYNDRYTEKNTNGARPSAYGLASTFKDKYFVSSDNVFKGDYFRFKQIQLGFTVPKKISRKYQIDNLRIFASLDDYITLTKYQGFDPEASSINTDNGLGLDYGNTPISRKIVVGLNLSF